MVLLKKIDDISNFVHSTGLTNGLPSNSHVQGAPLVRENQTCNARPEIQSEQIPKVCLISDSIGSNIELKTLEKALDSKIKVIQSYSAVDDVIENEAKVATKLPDKRIKNALENIDLANTETLIVQTGSVDITNLKTNAQNVGNYSEYFRHHVISAAAMFLTKLPMQ